MKLHLITLLTLWTVVATAAPAVHFDAADAAAGRITADALEPLLPAKPCGLGAPAADRHYWFDTLGKYYRKPEPIYQRAEKAAADFTPDFSDACWQDRARFDRYGQQLAAETEIIGRLTAAECLENRGRFLPEINRRAQRLANLKTWVTFHHDRTGFAFSGKGKFCDLLASDAGRTLAETDWLLGDKLAPETRSQIRAAVHAWLIEPYRASLRNGKPIQGMWWMASGNNWNAVCSYNVAAAAAMQIESRRERAELLASIISGVQHYLSGFSADGYCSEGASYWNYGFSHYLALAELIFRQTGGAVDLFRGTDKLAAVSRFALHADMGGRNYPAFADSPTTVILKYPLTVLLERRAGIAAYGAYSRHPAGTVPTWNAGELLLVKSALETPNPKTSPASAEQGHAFPQAGVLVSRASAPGGMFCAVKAGNNAEYHNHNDIGSFVIGIGGRPLLTDPGYPVYTADSFTPKRYDSDANNSFGHPVPVVNGMQQGSCGEFAPGAPLYYGKVVQSGFSPDEFTATLDLKPAYPADARVKSLTREFRHRRNAPESVVITDRFELDAPGRFGAALTTYASVRELGGGKFEFRSGKTSLIATIRSEGGTLVYSQAALRARYIQHREPPTRLGFEFSAPVQRGAIIVEVQPHQQGDVQ